MPHLNKLIAIAIVVCIVAGGYWYIGRLNERIAAVEALRLQAESEADTALARLEATVKESLTVRADNERAVQALDEQRIEADKRASTYRQQVVSTGRRVEELKAQIAARPPPAEPIGSPDIPTDLTPDLQLCQDLNAAYANHVVELWRVNTEQQSIIANRDDVVTRLESTITAADAEREAWGVYRANIEHQLDLTEKELAVVKHKLTLMSLLPRPVAGAGLIYDPFTQSFHPGVFAGVGWSF